MDPAAPVTRTRIRCGGRWPRAARPSGRRRPCPPAGPPRGPAAGRRCPRRGWSPATGRAPPDRTGGGGAPPAGGGGRRAVPPPPPPPPPPPAPPLGKGAHDRAVALDPPSGGGADRVGERLGRR